MKTLAVILAFIVYHLVVLNYAALVFDNKRNLKKIVIATTILNSLCIFFFYDKTTVHSEFLLMIGYGIVYLATFYYMSKRRVLVALFGMLAFSLNLFSRRIIFFSLFAVLFKMRIEEVYNSETLKFWANILPFLIAAPYISTTRKFLKKQYLDMMLSNKKNLGFAVAIMGMVYLFLVVMLQFMGTNTQDTGLILLYLIIGLVSSISYLMAMSYSFIFSRLELHVIRYETLKQNVSFEKKEVEMLESISTIDKATGLKNRQIARDVLEDFIKSKTPCHVIFVDMDGLKMVNDVYGHAEGDFYIQSVAFVLSEIFSDEIISREGGDEFLIVGEGENHYIFTEKTVRAFQRISEISKKYNKEYSTSISYGIIFVDAQNSLTAEEIISNADSKMYEFKKSRKLERKNHRR